MKGWITVVAAAKAVRKSRASVRKAIRDGRVPDGAVHRNSGSQIVAVNLDAVRAAFDGNSDPAQQLKQLGAAPRGSRYMDARTKREEFQSKLAEIDLQQRLGKMVEVDAVRAEFFAIRRRLRDRLVEALPSRVASQLASMTDARAIEKLLRDEARQCMSELAREFGDGAA